MAHTHGPFSPACELELIAFRHLLDLPFPETCSNRKILLYIAHAHAFFHDFQLPLLRSQLSQARTLSTTVFSNLGSNTVRTISISFSLV
jgi:hypothetical protein